MTSNTSLDLHTDPKLFVGKDVYAVAGNPISHSKSPVIHQYFAEQAQQAMHYGRLQPELDDFAKAARSFFAAGGKGMNVTAEDEFVYGRVCGKSKSLQIEVDYLRKKAQTAENEIEGQFWLSVMVLGFVIGVSLAFIYMAAVWVLQTRAYVPVTIKVPKFESKFA